MKQKDEKEKLKKKYLKPTVKKNQPLVNIVFASGGPPALPGGDGSAGSAIG